MLKNKQAHTQAIPNKINSKHSNREKSLMWKKQVYQIKPDKYYSSTGIGHSFAISV